MKKRKIIKLFGNIDQEKANYVFEQVLEILEENVDSKPEPIYLLINSTEGSYKEGIAISECLKLLPNKLIGAVIGNSSDATNIIFMNCDKKFATTKSTFCFTCDFKDIKSYSSYFCDLNISEEIMKHVDRYTNYVFEKDDLFERKIADYRLTKFEQLFEEEKH